jgi:hypothetical protein
VAGIDAGTLELVPCEVPFEVPFDALLELLLELLEVLLFKVLFEYGAQTFGLWNAVGSWVKYPSSNPSRYDLDNRQAIDEVLWYVS